MTNVSPKDKCFSNLMLTQKKSYFEILIVATMSAGKSTLINAMLGKDLIPSKNEACTAILTKIFNKKNISYPQARILSKSNDYSLWSSVDNERLQHFNECNDTQLIELNDNISNISNTSNINVILMDTPGPNNSMDSSHEDVTKDILDKSKPDIILYLLNSTQLSTNDDLKLLKLVRDITLSANKKPELIFVANKIDCFDPEKGESINHVISNVNGYLIENGIKNPTVIPVSAELAKLIRLKQQGAKLSRLQKSRLNSQVELLLEEPEMNLLKQAKMQISEKIYSQLIVELDVAKKQNNVLKQVEILSGIPVLEALINEKISLSDNKLFKVENLLQLLVKFEEYNQDYGLMEFESWQSKLSSNEPFKVSVLGSMSSGKSTLINAMLGRKLIPYKNEVWTAKLSKLYDEEGVQTFEAMQVTLDGKEDSWHDATAELLDNWNSQEDTAVIEVQSDIPEINQREGIQLVLVDTPGSNSSRDDSHQKATLEAITNNRPSMVLYLLDATQLGTNDDKILLNIIKDQIANGGKLARERFIFIVNKVDYFDSENGESIAGALNNVRQYLIDNGINNPTVIPVSASLTKMLRMQKNEGEKLSRLQRSSLNGLIDLFIEEPEMNLLEHSKSQISAQMYQILNLSLQAAKLSEDDEKAAEILSGVPIVEAMINDYMAKNCHVLRLNYLTNEFYSFYSQYNNRNQASPIIEWIHTELIKILQQ